MARKAGRAPRGARGLKFPMSDQENQILLGRAPRGARGLKSEKMMAGVNKWSRAPRGARGLK